MALTWQILLVSSRMRRDGAILLILHWALIVLHHKVSDQISAQTHFSCLPAMICARRSQFIRVKLIERLII